MLMVWVGNNEMKTEAAMERPTGAWVSDWGVQA